MQDIKVALIGYGFVGKVFHAPLIMATPGLELDIVSSSDAGKVHADLPNVRVSASPEAAATDAAIDLVVIASPNETHFPLARAALLAGKHVVVDKPFTIDLAQARELAAIAAESQGHLVVFHNRRWDSDFLGIRHVVETGILGRLSHIESRYDRFRPVVRDRWRERAGGGAGLWFDLGPHLIDQILLLCGLPDKIIASMAMQRDGAQTDDWAHVILEYGSEFGNLRAVLNCSVLAAGGGHRFMLHGDKASVVKHSLDTQEAQLRDGLKPGSPGWGADPEALVVFDENGNQRSVASPAGDYTKFYAGVADAIRGRGETPVPMPQAIAVMAVLEAATQSATSGQSVPLPLSAEERRQFMACTPFACRNR